MDKIKRSFFQDQYFLLNYHDVMQCAWVCWIWWNVWTGWLGDVSRYKGYTYAALNLGTR